MSAQCRGRDVCINQLEESVDICGSASVGKTHLLRFYFLSALH